MPGEEETGIAKIGPLEPVFESPELVKENIKKFREACKAILDPNVDMAMISGKQFIRKSGWNVLNQYFGVVTIPIKSWREDLGNDEYMITVVIQTSHKGIIGPARSASCTSMEMKEKHGNESYMGMESHCYGMAETRAVGRASAAWYMVGDPSAEEMEPLKEKKIPITPMSAPTEGQLETLKKLGYSGPKPESKLIASNIISDLKEDAATAEPAEDNYEKYCLCENPIPNSITNGKTCQTCKKLMKSE